MRPSFVTCRPALIAASALLACVITPAVAQDGPPPASAMSPGSGGGPVTGAGAPVTGNAPSAPSSGGAAVQGKILHTVPEDDLGAEDLTSSNRLVRDIIAKRSGEDLIICIAGCRNDVDRVVYAQPIDIKKPAPQVSNNDGNGGAQPPVTPTIANGASVSAKPMPAALTSEKVPAAADVKPAVEGAKPVQAPAQTSDSKPAAAPAATPSEAALTSEKAPAAAEVKPAVEGAKPNQAPAQISDTKPVAEPDAKPSEAASTSEAPPAAADAQPVIQGINPAPLPAQTSVTQPVAPEAKPAASAAETEGSLPQLVPTTAFPKGDDASSAMPSAAPEDNTAQQPAPMPLPEEVRPEAPAGGDSSQNKVE